MKLFLSERCTSTASQSLQKLGSLFKNVPHMTVTVEEEWEPTFGFWTNQYILFCA